MASDVEWLKNTPQLFQWLMGFGAFSISVLAIIKLWQTVFPTVPSQCIADIHDIKARLAALEATVGKMNMTDIHHEISETRARVDAIYRMLAERGGTGRD